MKIDIGIPEKERNQIAEGLSHLLADTYTLYLKTQKFHWNVTGPMFQALHGLFEKQYMELAEASDLIAERIRALGRLAPGSYAEFSKLSSVRESAAGDTKALDMVRELTEGHEAVAKTARHVFDLAEKGRDEATVDVLTERLQYHEKNAWMLRSFLEGEQKHSYATAG